MEKITAVRKAGQRPGQSRHVRWWNLLLCLTGRAVALHTAAAVGKCGQAVGNLVGGRRPSIRLSTVCPDGPRQRLSTAGCTTAPTMTRPTAALPYCASSLAISR